MTLGNKTIFGRACGASSKIVFSDLHFKAPNTQNTPFHFQLSKNNPQAEFCQIWASSVRLNAFCATPPPIFTTKSSNAFCVQTVVANNARGVYYES